MIREKWIQFLPISLALLCYVIDGLFSLSGIYELILYGAGYLVTGGPVLLAALKNIRHGSVFDENFLMSIATLGAFALGQYPEGLAVMTFYQIGELFQSYGVEKSRKTIEELMALRADYANLMADGKVIKTDPGKIQAGERILILPGERIPLDGTVIEGSSSLDTSPLTGESAPRDVSAGDRVQSGCVNINGTLQVLVDREYGESTVSRILKLVEHADSRKARTERFITRFARYYTPAVVIGAAALAVLPPILIPGATFADWIYRALTFLVISCPCALVLSIPLSFFGGIGGASKHGILIKGSNYLEALSRVKVAVFDKTGTLTEGRFAVTGSFPRLISEDRLLELAAYAEQDSNHPLAKAIVHAYGKGIDRARITAVREWPGYGMEAAIDGAVILAGNEKLMERSGIEAYEAGLEATAVHLAENGQYLGYLRFADALKEDTERAIRELKKSGIEKTVMLTGDTWAIAEGIADRIGLDRFHGELLPEDKVEILEALLKETPSKGKLLYAGDGINDAPVLARADIGIAMGGLGSDAAIEAADIVIMNDQPSKIPFAIRIARRTMRIVKQNIVFILSVKGLILVLGAFGIAGIWAAVFADVGVSVIAILNSLRTLNIKGSA